MASSDLAGAAARVRSLVKSTGRSARLVLIALVATCAPHGCSRGAPEEAIRANIAKIEAAVEQRDSGEVMGFLADGFLANGTMDRKAVHRMMAGYFLRFKNIRALVTDVAVEINPYDPVRAAMTAKVSVVGLDGLMPEDGNLYQVSGEWRVDNGEWLLYSFDWD